MVTAIASFNRSGMEAPRAGFGGVVGGRTVLFSETVICGGPDADWS
jgi:hypothetical protein